MAIAESAPPTPAIPLNDSQYSLPLKPVRETHTANVDRDYATGRKTINEYQVIEEIGRGQHGKVKLARDSINGHLVAIKIIPRLSKTRRLGKVSAADPQQNTKREIAILKKIRHENVVALLEVIDDPELQKIYMVLENVSRGEIVWRKKGLPNICYFERYRIEKGMHNKQLAPGERTWSDVLDRKATLRALREARTKNAPGPINRWTLQYGVTADDCDDGQLPWWFVADNSSPDFDPAPSVSPATSRGTSRQPSRVPSTTSVSSLPMHASYDSDPSPLSIMAQDGDSGAMTPSLPHPLNHAVASALEGSMYGPYTDDTTGFRRRSPSMADSIFSHMSSLDFNAVVHDPYADDFSYVPCFSIDQARLAFRDTVLGLEYLHYHGVVHRDIKPANLLWTHGFRVKISDFGVSYFGRPIRDGEPDTSVPESEAVNFDDDRELSKTVGTPAFFAPELCYTDVDKEPPKVSEQIDVWSLGVTLYCLIYARIPFLAEDEFSMFRKIATEEPYIPTSRLRPVGIFTDPTGSSLYQRTNVLPYRNDADPEYEQLAEPLLDLIKKMLTKNPEKRIRLRDVKRHEWVTEDIPNVEAWLADTDPARSQDRRIQVDEAEIGEAVVPLNFLQRARSAVKRAVDKVMHPRSERDESAVPSSRRRATSSAASSVVDAPISQPPTLGMPAALIHHHSHNHSHSHNHNHIRSQSQNPHHLPSTYSRDERRPSLRGDDYFATVTQMPSEHPLSQSVTVSPYASPGENTPSSGPEQQLIPADQLRASLEPATPERRHVAVFSVDGSDEADEADEQGARHTHSQSISNGVLSRDSFLRDILHTPTSTDGGAGSSVAPSVATTVRRARDIRSVTDAAFRARSVDRAGLVLPNASRRAEPVVGLSPALVPGSLQQPKQEGSLPSPIQSPKGVPKGASPPVAHAYRCDDAEPNGRESRLAADLPASERPATAQRIPPAQPAQATTPERPARNATRFVPPPSHKHLSFDLEDCESISDLPMLGNKSGTAASSSSASMEGMRSPGDASVSGASNKEGPNAMLAFQSDPSLPALLSGASSVSADVEGDFLGNPGIVDGTSLIDVSGSLARPAMEKTTVYFPLDQSPGSGLKDHQGWGSGGAIPVELDAQTARNTPVMHATRGRSSSVDGDEQDSDSDGGLVMARSRKKASSAGASRDPAAMTHGDRKWMARRRDTNTSIGSTETAKKVPMH